MNRLIIVGNGFDQAHGLKSSYKDFVYWYLKRCFERAEDRIYKDKSIEFSFYFNQDRRNDLCDLVRQVFDINAIFSDKSFNDRLLNEKAFGGVPVFGVVKGNVKSFYPDVLLVSDGKEIKFKDDAVISIVGTILRQTVDDIENKGWADIEKIYYKQLVTFYKEWENAPSGNSFEEVIEKVKVLNAELAEIKENLQTYLLELESEHYKDVKLQMNELFDTFDEVDFPHYKPVTSHEASFYNTEPKQVCILNFNYTTPFGNGADRINVINIHGYLNDINSMVFGYGDELDDSYQKIEASGEDVFLKHIKSFAYFKTKHYDKLVGFIEQGNFQVYIVGHSCALGDKTLLNQIFEHNYCKNIKTFFYTKEDGSDDFDETVFNIARIMKDKVKMRMHLSKKNDKMKFGNVKNLLSKPSKVHRN